MKPELKMIAKIREKIKELEKKAYNGDTPGLMGGFESLTILNICKELSDFIDSLSCTEKSDNSDVSKMETVWAPTPGEMIEVSNDTKQWWSEEFVSMKDDKYMTEKNKCGRALYKYARPLQDSPKIDLPSVPEFDYAKTFERFANDKYPEAEALIEVGKHLEKLTLGYQAIVKHLNNK